jgi:hypothetical protein
VISPSYGPMRAVRPEEQTPVEGIVSCAVAAGILRCSRGCPPAQAPPPPATPRYRVVSSRRTPHPSPPPPVARIAAAASSAALPEQVVHRNLTPSAASVRQISALMPRLRRSQAPPAC